MVDSTNARIDPRLAEVLGADQGILDTFGMTVESAENGVCELACIVPHELVNAGGFAHGSIAFSLLDTACAYALRSSGRRGVTVNANVSYIKGGQGGCALRARVAIVSQTRRVATLRGEVFLTDNETEDLAAHGTFVFQLRVEDSPERP